MKYNTTRPSTYKQNISNISNILRKHFNILHSSNRCKAVFKQPPFVAYRRSSNLREKAMTLEPHGLNRRDELL